MQSAAVHVPGSRKGHGGYSGRAPKIPSTLVGNCCLVYAADMARRRALLASLATWLVVAHAVHSGQRAGGTSPSVAGAWQLNATGPDGANSSSTPLILPTTVLIDVTDAAINITQLWTDSRGTVITVNGAVAAMDGANQVNVITSRDWPFNVFMGVEYDVHQQAGGRKATVTSHHGADAYVVQWKSPLVSQQLGSPTLPLAATETHSVSASTVDGHVYLTYHIQIPTPAVDVTYYYVPSSSPSTSPVPGPAAVSRDEATSRNAATDDLVPTPPSPPGDTMAPPFNFHLADNWTLVSPDFQQSAMVIGLQGLVNRNGPKLYLTYPSDWAYTYTPEVMQYYASSRDLTFTTVPSYVDLLEQLVGYVKGYVVWDPTVRESLVVAYTAAGLHDAIVVPPSMVALAQSHGLPMVANFSSMFRGLTPTQIYTKGALALHPSQCMPR